MSLRIIRPGLLTTVQDRGRYGLQHLGVVPCGPMDPVAFELGNALVGNHDGEAAIEITLLGPEIEFERDTLVAVCGALWLDALSENPLGVSLLPLFLPSFLMQTQRALILREQRFAQAVLGAGACAIFVILSLVLLVTMGRAPAVGWGTLWVLVVAAAGGALLVPGYGLVFARLEGVFFHQPRARPSHDPLRQIKRDRHLS